jgi:hypothetical protein
MRPEQVRIQAYAGNPLREKTRVLPGRQTAVRPAPAGEQIVARLLAGGGLHVFVDGLSRCLGQLKPDRPTSLLLPNSRAIGCITARGDIINLERHDIATTELTVDGEIEQSKVPNPTFDLELCPDGPDVFGAKWRLRSDDLSPIPRDTPRGGCDVA